MVLKSFQGSKQSFAKKIANELFNTMQDSVSEGAELLASDVYSVAKRCSFKSIGIIKLTILDGGVMMKFVKKHKSNTTFGN